MANAARKLAEEVHRYSAPDRPLRYGEEIDALRRACMQVRKHELGQRAHDKHDAAEDAEDAEPRSAMH